MDKKTLIELRPTIRSLGQDMKAVKTSYDALRAIGSMKPDGAACGHSAV